MKNKTTAATTSIPAPPSATPKVTFSRRLAEQQTQLAGNPTLQRFAASRQRLAADPYRPVYHFVSPESTMNDPNGLCCWQGRWHLFYQGYPPEDRRVHWGHAVSDDLIRWRDLPYAIHPGPETCCYSGTTWVESERVIAMYHGTELGNMVAVADDPLLLNWHKLTGTAVIPLSAKQGPPAFHNVFDPCLWKQGTFYYSLSGHGPRKKPDGRRANILFRSPDLIHWECRHEFIEGDRFTLDGDDAGCPYFLPIGDRHIMLFFSHMSGGQYLLGDYDIRHEKFVVSSHGRFNFGAWGPAGVHAPSAAPDGRGGIIVIFNMNPGKPSGEWNQIMSLPRRLTLASRDKLAMTPAGDWPSLRRDKVSIPKTELPANQIIPLKNIRGDTLEIEAVIDPADASVVEIDVLRSPDAEEFTRIAFFKGRGMLDGSLVSLDTSRSSTLPDVRVRAPETAPFDLSDNEPLHVRIFIDRSIVEVFVNDRQCVAARVYPGRPDSRGVSLRAQGQSATLRSGVAWSMQGQ